MPVYEPIREYAVSSWREERVEVCYNTVNPDHLLRKENYELHQPPRLVSVGRQLAAKNPDNIIRALARLPGVELVMIGDGPAHEDLRAVASASGVSDRVRFHRSVPNDQLCRELRDSDMFVIHSEYWGIPKTVIEAMLTGLPVVLNHRQGAPVPEFQGNWLRLVANTPGDYATAIAGLLEDDGQCAALGRRAAAEADRRYVPARTEARFVEMYRSLLEASSAC